MPIVDSEGPDIAVATPIQSARDIPNADRSGQWIREDREAQRFRTAASSRPEWKYVTQRPTVDLDTGDVLGDIHDVQTVARGAVCQEAPSQVWNLRTTLRYVPPPSIGAAAGSAPVSSVPPGSTLPLPAPASSSSLMAAAPRAPPPPPVVDYHVRKVCRAARWSMEIRPGERREAATRS